MRKNEFLSSLDKALSDLDTQQKERYLADYAELIDDRVESGMDEESAVDKLGSISSIATPIIADAREQGILKAKRSPLMTGLIILGSPVWFSLALAAAAVLLAVYVVVWTVIFSACAVEISIIAVAPAAVIYFFTNIAAHTPFSLFVLGIGFVCAAVALALFFPIRRLVKSLAYSSIAKAKQLLGYIETKRRFVK